MTAFEKIPLNGADKFIYALEGHNASEGSSGNTCHYVMQLDGKISVPALTELLEQNKLVQALACLQLPAKSGTKNNWSKGKQCKISIEELDSNEILPSQIQELKQTPFKAPLFYFHVVHRSDDTDTIIFSWHHLLMDGYGASLFLKNLIEPIPLDSTTRDVSGFTFGIFRQMVKAKQYITRSSKGNIAAMETGVEKNVQQRMRVISFSAVESEALAKQLAIEGGVFGATNALLIATARCVDKLLRTIGQSTDADFWLPIPQDKRPKGTNWPVVGNQLSFLFYRINRATLSDKKGAIKALNDQMMLQIKQGIPVGYGHLMNYLRRIPTGLYRKLIKGSNRKSLSSFLFTIAAPHPKTLSSFMDCKVVNALSIPPNTYPPGLTFAVNQFEGNYHIVVLYYHHLMNDVEIDQLEASLRSELNGIT